MAVSVESALTAVNASETPTSDSLVHLLIQGLQSKDKQMLETVLNNDDDKVIRNTIKRLPIECITAFLNEIQSRLFNRGENTIVYLKWLQQLLHIKFTFIMTLPNTELVFGPLLELLNARTNIMDRIYRLKGRLNLMMSQIHSYNTGEVLFYQKPQISYESSSSSDEEEDIMEDENDVIKELMDEDNDNEELEPEDEEVSDQQSTGGEEDFESAEDAIEEYEDEDSDNDNKNYFDDK